MNHPTSGVAQGARQQSVRGSWSVVNSNSSSTNFRSASIVCSTPSRYALMMKSHTSAAPIVWA